jgi:hypothetical protein
VDGQGLVVSFEADCPLRNSPVAGVESLICISTQKPLTHYNEGTVSRHSGKDDQMSRMDDLRQAATPLDRFLHASVGDDRKGNPVTVLSTFARLGLDPWDEASDLSNLPREGARLRLGGLLARFRDVAVPGDGSATTTQRLIDLLPQNSAHPARGTVLSVLPAQALGLPQILSIIAVFVVLLRTFFVDSGGSGN